MKIERISAIWCPSCLLMKSRWEKVETEFKNINFIDYDYDMDEEFVQNKNIGKKLPVCIIYKENQEVGRIIGEKTEEELINLLKEFSK